MDLRKLEQLEPFLTRKMEINIKTDPENASVLIFLSLTCCKISAQSTKTPPEIPLCSD